MAWAEVRGQDREREVQQSLSDFLRLNQVHETEQFGTVC